MISESPLRAALDSLVTPDAVEGPTIALRLAAEGEGPFGMHAALNDFAGQDGRVLLATGGEGPPLALFGLGEAAAPLSPTKLRAASARLPPGDYRLEPRHGLDAAQAALAWALGARVFNRFKSPALSPRPRARLVLDAAVLAEIAPVVEGCALACDMVDTPPNHMGPAEIETATRELAHAHGAAIAVVVGEALLAQGYPAVHAVGRAAAPHRAPRMIELTWIGAEAGPKVVLVGKGVAFDTGGLDLKPSAGMRLMKKDMGGAAHVLGLAHMVMAARLPVRLTVLIPAVENAVSADAMRPSDVLATRAGLTVEVGNTDAEGRLILADALTRAGELEPDLTLDLATLTGAARVALGPQVIPVFTDDEALAADLAAAAQAEHDPLWRLPLWSGYDDALGSDVADLKNDGDGWAQGGAIVAGLFLRRFAPRTGAWAHLDIYAWNPRGRPGWPLGAEAQAIRALRRLLIDRYAR